MSSFQQDQFVKLLSDPQAEARRIMLVAAADAKPLKCLPVSTFVEGNTAGPFEEYSPDELRPAGPGEFSLKTSRGRLVDYLHDAHTEFRRDVPQQQYFQAFQQVADRFNQDERVSAEARALFNQAVDHANKHQKPWHSIVVEYALNSQVPADGYEGLIFAFKKITQQHQISQF